MLAPVFWKRLVDYFWVVGLVKRLLLGLAKELLKRFEVFRLTLKSGGLVGPLVSNPVLLNSPTPLLFLKILAKSNPFPSSFFSPSGLASSLDFTLKILHKCKAYFLSFRSTLASFLSAFSTGSRVFSSMA